MASAPRPRATVDDPQVAFDLSLPLAPDLKTWLLAAIVLTIRAGGIRAIASGLLGCGGSPRAVSAGRGPARALSSAPGADGMAASDGPDTMLRLMTSQGSSYSRFQRALTTHNLAIITAAARELPAIDLHDAARITAVIARERPERLDAAGVRWLHRYCTEHGPTLDELARATAALQTMREDHDRGLRELLHTTRPS